MTSEWTGQVVMGPLPPGTAQRLAAALAPESGGGVPHTHIVVELEHQDRVRLSVSAPSTSALRAALNAHLRWAALGLKVEDLASSPRAE